MTLTVPWQAITNGVANEPDSVYLFSYSHADGSGGLKPVSYTHLDVYKRQALRKVEEWYVGDGFYSDGPGFAFDYYNSFVLHPMYVECLEAVSYTHLDVYKRQE